MVSHKKWYHPQTENVCIYNVSHGQDTIFSIKYYEKHLMPLDEYHKKTNK